MALNKAVKVGGSLYKGYELLVTATTGDHVIAMTETAAASVNSISVTPDTYGSGDNFKLEHITSDSSLTLALLAETIYNPGKNVAVMFDFPALERVDAGEIFKLTYSNVSTDSKAMHIIVEYVGIRRTV